jgi:hypothetical protein
LSINNEPLAKVIPSDVVKEEIGFAWRVFGAAYEL